MSRAEFRTIATEPTLCAIAGVAMPEGDRLEVIMFLKREQPGAKMIALSAPRNELFFPSTRALRVACGSRNRPHLPTSHVPLKSRFCDRDTTAACHPLPGRRRSRS